MMKNKYNNNNLFYLEFTNYYGVVRSSRKKLSNLYRFRPL